MCRSSRMVSDQIMPRIDSPRVAALIPTREPALQAYDGISKELLSTHHSWLLGGSARYGGARFCPQEINVTSEAGMTVLFLGDLTDLEDTRIALMDLRIRGAGDGI